MAESAGRKCVYALGHSNRTLEDFLRILEAYGLRLIADVRTIPRSRHNPQFNSDALSASLAAHGIAYTPLKELGGLRRPRPDSRNTAWRNAGFRGYADYMETPEFGTHLAALESLAAARPTAILCAEAVPWRCHRSFIADALLARGWQVEQILSTTKSHPHKLTPFAHIDNQRVTYPGLLTRSPD
ncbi:MAG: DUF488 domain-containing protein [Acidobacteria bacterium]|nr:DUF488 domain-containing protein [Acidobacteriota bacterium]